MTGRSIEASPQFYARLAASLYLITIFAGTSALVFAEGRQLANLIAGASYVAVTVLFYYLFRPVSRNLSLLAMLLSLAGCVWGALSAFGLVPAQVSPLIFFGFYCLLLGFLIFNSTFLPRWLGVLMVIGGLGWLTFLAPPLVKQLTPYNMLPGIIAETTLTLWLLVKGVDVDRWKERAHVRGAATA